MEHEFVPGKRRCRVCHQTAKFVREFDEPCDQPVPLDEASNEPPPEPDGLMWHLNVWTTVNDVTFAGQATSTGDPHIELIEAVGEIVANIVTNSTPAEE
jgi:hypothetical protein